LFPHLNGEYLKGYPVALKLFGAHQWVKFIWKRICL